MPQINKTSLNKFYTSTPLFHSSDAVTSGGPGWPMDVPFRAPYNDRNQSFGENHWSAAALAILPQPVPEPSTSGSPRRVLSGETPMTYRPVPKVPDFPAMEREMLRFW